MTSARHHPHKVASLPSVPHVLELMMEYMKQGEAGGGKCPVLEKSTLDLVNSSSNDNNYAFNLRDAPCSSIWASEDAGPMSGPPSPGTPWSRALPVHRHRQRRQQGKGGYRGSKPREAPTSSSASSATWSLLLVPDTAQGIQNHPFLLHSGHGFWEVWSFKAKKLWITSPFIFYIVGCKGGLQGER